MLAGYSTNIEDDVVLNKEISYFSKSGKEILKIFELYLINVFSIKKIEINSKNIQRKEFDATIDKERFSVSYKIENYKKNVLKTTIYGILLNAYAQNHALITDKKIMLSIPYLEIMFLDDFFVLFELYRMLKIVEDMVTLLERRPEKTVFRPNIVKKIVQKFKEDSTKGITPILENSYKGGNRYLLLIIKRNNFF